MLAKLQRALAAREKIRESGTDALRLVDGRGDGFDGFELEDFAGRWLVQTRGKSFPEWLKTVLPAPKSIYWKRLGEEKTAPEWIAGASVEAPFVVSENGVKFWIDFAAGYSQGIFLDQRGNRARLRQIALGKTVLNCFAYTCAFGVCAALGGATTVNLDLSKNYLDWGRRNCELNGIDPSAHEFIFGDVFNWLDRFRKKERCFDLIVLDPPTFARDDKGRVFTVEKNFDELVAKAADVLAPGGTLLCSTNQRSLSVASFRELVTRGLKNPAAWKIESAPMPADFTGEKYLKSFWISQR